MTTTKEHTLQFLSHFTSSHSWYKHLSMEVPCNFVFFIDKNAWQNVKGLYPNSILNDFFEEVSKEDKIVITDTDQTKIKREKYGFWNFNGGSIRGFENDIQSTYIINENLEKELLSSDKIELGKIGLTAFIHSSFSSSSNEEFKERHIQEFEKLKEHLLHILEFREAKYNTANTR